MNVIESHEQVDKKKNMEFYKISKLVIKKIIFSKILNSLTYINKYNIKDMCNIRLIKIHII